MTEQQQLLAGIRSSIRDIESHIACAEKVMREIPAMPVIDLEDMRSAVVATTPRRTVATGCYAEYGGFWC